MIDFLHTNLPDPILISLGAWSIHWYGALIVLGMIAGIGMAMKLAPKYGVGKETVIDLAFWLIIFGIAGARIYHVFLELPYYTQNPLNIFKLWEGGLAIHGALLAGIGVLFVYSRKQNISFWILTGILVPGLALAQAIGRWGNYFNRELFGYPTDLPWGIPIPVAERPIEFLNSAYFHPAFLYESAGNLIIFLLLITLHLIIIKNKKQNTRKGPAAIVAVYVLAYSILRFSTEFIRIDPTPILFGLRFPQVASLLLMSTVAVFIILLFSWPNKKQNTGVEK